VSTSVCVLVTQSVLHPVCVTQSLCVLHAHRVCVSNTEWSQHVRLKTHSSWQALNTECMLHQARQRPAKPQRIEAAALQINARQCPKLRRTQPELGTCAVQQLDMARPAPVSSPKMCSTCAHPYNHKPTVPGSDSTAQRKDSATSPDPNQTNKERNAHITTPQSQHQPPPHQPSQLISKRDTHKTNHRALFPPAPVYCCEIFLPLPRPL
jgi:hypothetical protein